MALDANAHLPKSAMLNRVLQQAFNREILHTAVRRGSLDVPTGGGGTSTPANAEVHRCRIASGFGGPSAGAGSYAGISRGTPACQDVRRAFRDASERRGPGRAHPDDAFTEALLRGRSSYGLAATSLCDPDARRVSMPILRRHAPGRLRSPRRPQGTAQQGRRTRAREPGDGMLAVQHRKERPNPARVAQLVEANRHPTCQAEAIAPGSALADRQIDRPSTERTVRFRVQIPALPPTWRGSSNGRAHDQSGLGTVLNAAGVPIRRNLMMGRTSCGPRDGHSRGPTNWL